MSEVPPSMTYLQEFEKTVRKRDTPNWLQGALLLHSNSGILIQRNTMARFGNLKRCTTYPQDGQKPHSMQYFNVLLMLPSNRLHATCINQILHLVPHFIDVSGAGFPDGGFESATRI
jgi:hypothetical protein